MFAISRVARSSLLKQSCAQSAVARRSLQTSASVRALTKFSMPAMSPTMTEGGIASWKKQEGESFVTGDVLLEIETDKATMDVEAQDDGIMAKIVIGDGVKGIPVGTVIAVLGEEGDDVSGADALAKEGSSDSKPKPSSSDSSSSSSSSSSSAGNSSGGSSSQSASTASENKDASKAGTQSTSTTSALATPSDETKYGSGGTTEAQKGPKDAGGEDKPKFFASPLARKVALEKGVPLGEIKGTGPEGRIVKADVEKYASSSSSSSSSSLSTTAKTPTSGSSTLPGSAAPAAPNEYEDIPVSSMRKTIGKRLTESKQQLPHYYVTVEVNMDRIAKLREMFNKAGDGKVKLSVNDFIIKASALALADVPEVNTAWLGDVIRQYKQADICVAVATPTGLITPIVKNAGAKGLASISADVKALAVKARDGKLKPEEYQGGTFTISNLGMFGVQEFTAIINPPQSAILAVGGTTDRLVPAPETEKGFKVSQMMNATLSSDHRTVDGAVASRWLKAFKGYMEQPLTFML